MAEELVLTDPVVVPEVVTNKYKVTSMTLSRESGAINPATQVLEPGLIMIQLRDNNNVIFVHNYYGAEAIDLIKWLNTANFSVNSMHKRILQKLTNDGVLVGTVTGTPEPPIGVFK